MNLHIDAPAESRRGLLLIVLAAVLWGTVGVATKTIFELSDTNPLSIGFFRLAFAVPVLLVACRGALGRRMFRVTHRDLRLMLLMGALMALYQVCYFAAIERVGVAIAVLVTLCTAPVMIALLSALLLRERLTGAVLLALVCALAGTAMLVGVGPDTSGARKDTLVGVLLALGSAFGYTVLTLCSRALAGRYHALQPITIGFAAGALLLLPFALATGFVFSYPAGGWALLLYLGLVPTALAYVLFLSGIRRITATVASIVTLVEPLTSTTLAWLLFGEQLGPLGVFGAALLLGAIGLLYRGEARQTRSLAAPDTAA
ncbi:MAG TPA: EamA family transporter [Roseiflexaceae bacterium]|nr:EamA family transporter [Roseiflexaceae bacterium]